MCWCRGNVNVENDSDVEYDGMEERSKNPNLKELFDIRWVMGIFS